MDDFGNTLTDPALSLRFQDLIQSSGVSTLEDLKEFLNANLKGLDPDWDSQPTNSKPNEWTWTYGGTRVVCKREASQGKVYYTLAGNHYDRRKANGYKIKYRSTAPFEYRGTHLQIGGIGEGLTDDNVVSKVKGMLLTAKLLDAFGTEYMPNKAYYGASGKASFVWDVSNGCVVLGSSPIQNETEWKKSTFSGVYRMARGGNKSTSYTFKNFSYHEAFCEITSFLVAAYRRNDD